MGIKVIENYEDLLDKTIVFIDLGDYSDMLTIVTRDRYVYMSEFNVDGLGDVEPNSLNEFEVVEEIYSNSWLRKKLVDFNIKMDVQAYRKEAEKIRKAELKEHEIEIEMRERAELKRLKMKYEDTEWKRFGWGDWYGG